MYGITNERVSDFGLRKILGIRNPNVKYIDGLSPLKKDTYMLHRKKIRENVSDDTKRVAKKATLISAALGVGAAVIAGIRKKILVSRGIAGAPKIGFFTKLRNRFTRK